MVSSASNGILKHRSILAAMTMLPGRSAIVVNERVLSSRICRLESRGISDDMCEWETRHGGDIWHSDDRRGSVRCDVANNSCLPLIVYRSVLETGGDATASCVALFNRNDWTGAWQNGVIRVITITVARTRCSASPPVGSVGLGGEGGQRVELRAGDVVVIPAGVRAGKVRIFAVPALPITHAPAHRLMRSRCPQATRYTAILDRYLNIGALGCATVQRPTGNARCRRCRRRCRTVHPRLRKAACLDDVAGRTFHGR
jgi:hypothetical protein